MHHLRTLYTHGNDDDDERLVIPYSLRMPMIIFDTEKQLLLLLIRDVCLINLFQ
jgi:hypothetical protein